MLTSGIIYPLNLIPDDERLSRLNFNIECRNHLTYSDKANVKLHDFASKELGKGFLLPIPKNKIKSIPNAEVCPIHIIT